MMAGASTSLSTGSSSKSYHLGERTLGQHDQFDQPCVKRTFSSVDAADLWVETLRGKGNWNCVKPRNKLNTDAGRAAQRKPNSKFVL